MNLRSCPYNRDFGGNAGILIFHSFIFTISLFFWILPSCALLCGIKRNQCGLFVPWILSMGFQSPMLAWALVEHFNEILKYYRTIEISLVVALLPILALIIMQIIVWRACLRIKRNRSRNTNRYIRALICYLHNPKFFFLEIPRGPLGISIGNIQSAQKAFRVPQSSVFCHFQCFIEISPKNGICSQSRIFWPIFKCHTILESYRQHGRRATLQVKIRGLNKEL